MCPKCGVRQSQAGGRPKKDRVTAALLAFFLGGLGVHHFYLGNTIRGILYVLFFWTLIPALVAFVDFIILICMSEATFAERYGDR